MLCIIVVSESAGEGKITRNKLYVIGDNRELKQGPQQRERERERAIYLGAKKAKTATATKTSLENKHLGKGDYFSDHFIFLAPFIVTEHAKNGLVEEPLK